MDAIEAFEVEGLLNELERYEYPFIKHKIVRIKEVLQPIFENEREKEFKRKRNLKWSWNKFNPSVKCQQAQQNLTAVVNYYNEAKEEIASYDRETQDILHAIELTDLSDEELTGFMKRLKDIRVFRRKAKDFVLLAEPLVNFAEQNRNVIKQLGKIHNEIQANITKFEKRTYTPRELTTLEEAFKQASISKG